MDFLDNNLSLIAANFNHRQLKKLEQVTPHGIIGVIKLSTAQQKLECWQLRG